ncbi:MAG: L-histidine N(alpha)-methyltransferase, partial [Actinobacteria bacterium]
EILDARAGSIADATRADTLVELGSGTSEKTRLLLSALRDRGVLRRFIPFDVSESTLRGAAGAIVAEYPGLDVHAVVGDFEHHLDLLPTGGRRLIAFLGGTIGNLPPAPRAEFLADVVATMADEDSFLLGTDLVKDAGRLHAAYDDSAGVTAAFNRNVLSVLNRELGASFDLTRFEHVARFDTHDEWIEMRLRSTEAQTVPVPALGIEAVFTAGEEMRTEISAKFRPEGVERELDAAGLVLKEWWTDRAGDFALSLSVRG